MGASVIGLVAGRVAMKRRGEEDEEEEDAENFGRKNQDENKSLEEYAN